MGLTAYVHDDRADGHVDLRSSLPNEYSDPWWLSLLQQGHAAERRDVASPFLSARQEGACLLEYTQRLAAQTTSRHLTLPLVKGAAMSTIKNIVGQRFGLLVVLEPKGVDRHSKMRWLCACDCGNTSIAIGCDLRSGKTKSCGCRAGKTTHGMHRTWIYQLWWNIRSRCLNPRCPEYKNYGGRGITLCDRWLKDFVILATEILAALGERPPGMSLDRVDNDGDYEPGNVRWATPSQQTANQRRHLHKLCAK